MLKVSKGVVVGIWDDERMPIDDYSIRADMIVAPDAAVKRGIAGRLYEHYAKYTMIHFQKQLRDLIGDRDPYRGELFEQLSEMVLDFYRIISDDHYKIFMRHYNKVADKAKVIKEELAQILNDYPQIVIPLGSLDIGPNQVRRIMASQWYYPPTPITFINELGDTVRTVGNIEISNAYILVLEKISEESWSASSSPLRQVHGFVVKGGSDKATVDNATRIPGEDESRIIVNTCGGDVISDVMLQTNSSVIHKRVCELLVGPDNQYADGFELYSNEDAAKEITKPVEITRNLTECAGFTLDGDLHE